MLKLHAFSLTPAFLLPPQDLSEDNEHIACVNHSGPLFELIVVHRKIGTTRSEKERLSTVNGRPSQRNISHYRSLFNLRLTFNKTKLSDQTWPLLFVCTLSLSRVIHYKDFLTYRAYKFQFLNSTMLKYSLAAFDFQWRGKKNKNET